MLSMADRRQRVVVSKMDEIEDRLLELAALLGPQ